jgi:hypothetical protein
MVVDIGGGTVDLGTYRIRSCWERHVCQASPRFPHHIEPASTEYIFASFLHSPIFSHCIKSTPPTLKMGNPQQLEKTQQQQQALSKHRHETQQRYPAVPKHSHYDSEIDLEKTLLEFSEMENQNDQVFILISLSVKLSLT